VFKTDLLLAAYAKAARRNMQPTDDAMVVESLGKRVAMVKGSYRNIKITKPIDLELAKILLKKRA
jgi:2-C-methyl-D-erythritol 4-phosphate cytidylyltransferase